MLNIISVSVTKEKLSMELIHVPYNQITLPHADSRFYVIQGNVIIRIQDEV